MTNKIESDLQELFPIPSIDQWKDTVALDLKGKTAESLERKNYDGINIKPLFTEADTNNILFKGNFPGFLNYVRGFKPDGNIVSNWLMAQEIYAEDVSSLKRKIIHDIASGLNCVYLSIHFNGENIFLNSSKASSIAEVRDFIMSEEFRDLPFIIFNYNSPFIIREIFTGINFNSNVTIESDIFTSVFYTGEFYDNSYSELMKNSDTLKSVNRIVTMNGSPVSDAGGNATQEIAVILSMASEILNNTNIEPGKFSAIVAMESDFFLNIAKVRALRILWANLLTNAGKESSDSLFIHAVDTRFNKSRLDKYNNVLRSATETFSASLSDCDAITTLPFDFIEGSSSELAERIARNLQLVIANETNTGKVIDPLGGTYYIEYLTSELANRAWEFFIKIENQGGFISSSKNGFLKTSIEKEAAKKFLDIETSKFKLTGVNSSPNEHDELSTVDEKNNYRYRNLGSSLAICEPLSFTRLSKAFEELRFAVQSDKAHNKIFVLSFGELREHKPRTDFANSLLATGGFSVVSNSDSTNFETSINELINSGCKVAIACSSDENYDSKLFEFLLPVKDSFKFFLAGKPGERETEYRSAGIDDFIFMNCNYIEKLKAIADKSGVQL